MEQEISEYLAQRKAEGLAATTLESAGRRLRRMAAALRALGVVRVQDTQSAHLDAYVDGNKVAGLAFGDFSTWFAAGVEDGSFESSPRFYGKQSEATLKAASNNGLEKFRGWWHKSLVKHYTNKVAQIEHEQTIEEARPLANAIEKDIWIYKYEARMKYRIYNFIMMDALDKQDRVQASLDQANYFAARHEASITLSDARACFRRDRNSISRCKQCAS